LKKCTTQAQVEHLNTDVVLNQFTTGIGVGTYVDASGALVQVTALDADAFDVSVSDDGGTISFASAADPLGTNTDGSSEVFLADGSGVVLRRGEHRAKGRGFELTFDNGRTVCGKVPSYSVPEVKNAAGYFAADDMDLLDLFVGMEGTLGILTEVGLRLTRAPECIWGLVAFMPSEATALRLVRVLRGEEVPSVGCACQQKPVAMEYFGSSALGLLRKQKSENPAFSELPPLSPEQTAAVYAEYHGADEDAVTEAVMAASEAIVALGGDEDATWVASDRPSATMISGASL